MRSKRFIPLEQVRPAQFPWSLVSPQASFKTLLLATEGLQVGEELHFEVQGQRAEQSLVYSGQMDIKHLALTFGAAQAMASVFPNPFVESLQVSAVVETPGYLMCELTDAVGKVVAQQPMGWQAKGAFTGTWEVLGLAPGMYTCKILKDDEVLLTTPVLKR